MHLNHIFEREGRKFLLVAKSNEQVLDHTRFLKGQQSWNDWFDKVQAMPNAESVQWRVIAVSNG
jgi:hypothetical protein